jgi:hypothetical protein
MSDISRREMVGGIVAGAASLSMAGQLRAEEAKKAMRQHRNEDFYGADGKFNAAAAKEAYYEMMRYVGYPIVDRLKTDDFWALDFGLGKFVEAGMAGIFWVNNKEHNYFGHEIYLLPGQAIPEHKHVKTDVPCKMEGWQPRYGFIYIYGEEGTPTAGVAEKMPATHGPFTRCKCERILRPGEVAGLAKAEEWHFMRAGPEGAIVTEYATYHDGAGLRFANPQAKV